MLALAYWTDLDGVLIMYTQRYIGRKHPYLELHVSSINA